MSITTAETTNSKSGSIWGNAVIAIFIGFAGVGTIAWFGLIGWCALTLCGY
jgi:hypothetical protein